MPHDDGRPAVLVTGAAGGIGAATTRSLQERGYRVYAGVRPGRLAAGVPGAPDADVVELDVTEPQSVRSAAKQIAASQGTTGLHALVNNAGVIVQGPLELVPPAELERQLAVNVLGPADVTQAFLPLLRQGAGRVVNISAPTGRLALPFAAPISASKAALESLSDALRVELAPWKIPVIVIVPGGIDTPIFAKAADAARNAQRDADPDRLALYRAQIAAVEATTARMRTSPADTVAATVVRAVRSSRPRRRYTANADARMFALIARLPAGPRDRLLTRALGLKATAA